VPHIIAGDFDSASKEQLSEQFRSSEIVELPDQNQGDLEKSIEVCIARGASSVTLLGFSGGRTDHALTNLSVVLKFAHHLKITIVNGEERIYGFNGVQSDHTRTLWCLPKSCLSIIPFSERVTVTASDLLWPVDGLTLHPGSRGLSNRANSDRTTITVSAGLAIVTVTASD
jgi:thiamine pyrophosphokinase